MKITALPLIAAIAMASALVAQSMPAQSTPAAPDSATFDRDGTAHITRVIPMPASISPEAQKWLDSLNQQKVGPPESLAERRTHTDEWRKSQSAEARRLYPVNVEETTMAGVRTDIITPLSNASQRVLINLHGGGFNSDSGSLIEGVPIAQLLKTYAPKSIGIFGTSAGAILTAEAAVRFKQLGLPEPAALGIFSGIADFSRAGDARQIFSLNGLPGRMEPVDPNHLPDDQYVAKTDRKDPVLSPLFADLHGMPPSLLVTSTRDLLLSDTAIFHRALLAAGDDAQLVVFEALPHAFWYHFQLPETKEALAIMARFFDEKVAE